MKHLTFHLIPCLCLLFSLNLPAQDNTPPSTSLPSAVQIEAPPAPANRPPWTPATTEPAAKPETPAPAVPAAPAEPPATPAVVQPSTPPAAEPVSKPTPAPKPQPKVEPTTPSEPPAPKVEREVPHTFGDRTGQVYIGHRAVVERYAGWGWIWKEGEGYRRGKWVLMQEEPGVRMVPGRFRSHPEADNDMEYKIYGEFLPFRGYEPNYDVFTDVFKIKGFEVIGKADPLKLRPPAPTNKSRNSSSSRVHEISID